MCLKALEIGGNAGAIVNGANEAAIALFLNKKIKFTDIVMYCSEALECIEHIDDPDLNDIFETDKKARSFVNNKVVN